MTEHHFLCKTNCDEPLELINIIDGDPEFECAHGHVSHECSCDDIAARRGEREAEAAAEHLQELGRAVTPG